MGILSNIMGKIFGHAEAATPAKGPAGQDATKAPAAGAATAPQSVDVAAVLAKMAAEKGEKLNYATSIVDLLTLLGMDSSLEARRELAKELGYTGSTEDTAAMNTWLIKQVYAALAQNGGHLPANWPEGK
ncbi:DUF3597 domain-containing protein [Formicincola oecophyllae]|uniref:DUF3597 domain-containing protein n=1 Tax=Formicincola oecophyllae TaxID=2558361 RepID=A0A4Y6UAL7_9PROT|nr:DUF3597 domain-containing protein [Formicincola oecophyllae]QDH13497.1 DUF3597 domain-containing protein [Formicincola oecophyllae]